MDDFLSAVAKLDPRVRKLLSDCHVRTQMELEKLDPWPLIHQRGVGRSSVRALAMFMRERGVQVSATPLVAPRAPKLVVSFPDDLALAVHERAAHEELTPSALVVQIVRRALDKPR
jgi:hypothetical protein